MDPCFKVLIIIVCQDFTPSVMPAIIKNKTMSSASDFPVRPLQQFVSCFGSFALTSKEQNFVVDNKDDVL